MMMHRGAATGAGAGRGAACGELRVLDRIVSVNNVEVDPSSDFGALLSADALSVTLEVQVPLTAALCALLPIDLQAASPRDSVSMEGWVGAIPTPAAGTVSP